jgi:hypothetical protein
MSCKLRRLYITPIKSLPPSTVSGGVKAFFTKTQRLEILQLSNANLSNDFLRYKRKKHLFDFCFFNIENYVMVFIPIFI